MTELINKTIDNACEIWGVSKEDVFGRLRKQPFPFVRCMIAYNIHQRTDLTLTAIGKILKRTHASIIFYLDMYNMEYAHNKEFRSKANKLEKRLGVSIGDRLKRVFDKLSGIC